MLLFHLLAFLPAVLYASGLVSVLRHFPSHIHRVPVIKRPLTSGRPKIVFDLDDTLYASSTGLQMSLVNNMHTFVQKVHNLNESDAKKRAERLYFDHGSTIRGLVVEYGHTAAGYEEHLNENIEYQRIGYDEKLVDLFKRANADIVIFTNSDRMHTERVLETLGIMPYVHMIFFVYSNSPDFPLKPSPEAYKRVEYILGAKGADIYFVDDNKPNTDEALKHGWNVARVKEGSAMDLNSTTPTISSVNEIPLVFKSIFASSDEQTIVE